MQSTLPATTSGRLGWLAAGALAGVLGAVLVAPSLTSVRAGTDTEMREHTLSVSGVGRVKVEPDVADVSIGVRVQRDRARDAEVDAAAAMTDVVAALQAQGIAEDDIQTTTLSLSPVYDYNRTPERLVGYEATNIVSITIRDLETAGQVVDAATDAGATEIGSLQFRVEDQAAVEAQAREQAMLDARSKADALAEAGGVTITGVITIVEGSAPPPMPVDFRAAAEAADEAARPTTPVLGGEVEVMVSVAVIYSIS
jgi:uncharacterized protein YggE